jgi:hypothetical protein
VTYTVSPRANPAAELVRQRVVFVPEDRGVGLPAVPRLDAGQDPTPGLLDALIRSSSARGNPTPGGGVGTPVALAW